MRAEPARFPARGKARSRGGTVLVVPLAQPGRLRVTVYGPGPSCNRLGTFGRRGRAGVNRFPFSGRLYGRRLPAGTYSVVIEVVRGSRRVQLGRVLVQILPRDGREGASRPLMAPNCAVEDALRSSLAAVGDFVSSTGGGFAASESGLRTAGVAGVSEATGQREPRRSQPLPALPPLPPLPSIDSGSPLDAVASPFFLVGVLALLGGAAAAAAVVYGVRRRREAFWY